MPIIRMARPRGCRPPKHGESISRHDAPCYDLKHGQADQSEDDQQGQDGEDLLFGGGDTQWHGGD